MLRVLAVACLALSLTAQKQPDVRVSTGRAAGAANSGSPQLAASGSTLCIVWPDNRGGGSDVYANSSQDAGATWLLADVRVSHGPAGSHAIDPRLAAARSSPDMCAVWIDDRNGGSDVYGNVSHDGGASWLMTDFRLDTGSAPGAGAADHVRVAVSGSSIYAVWIDARSSSGDVYANVSHDSGATWLPADVKLNSGSGGASNPAIAAADPFVHVVWNDARNGHPDVYYSRSSNSGSSWFPTDVRLDVGNAAGSTVCSAPCLAIAQANVYVAWTDTRNAATTVTTGNVFVMASHDVGTSWPLQETRVDDFGGPPLPGGAAVPSLVAVGSTVAAAWSDLRAGAADVFVNSSPDAGASWRGDQRLDLGDAPGASASWDPQIAAAGTVIEVVWIDHRSGAQVRANRSPDLGANWLTTDLRLDGIAAPGNGATAPQLALGGSAGFAAWVDDRSNPFGNLDVYFDLAFGWQPYGTATPGSFGGIPRLAGSGALLVGTTASLDVQNGLGGAAGVLLLGLGPASQISLPLLGGTLLVNPAATIPITLGGPTGVPGTGSRSTAVPIPNDHVLLGLDVDVQCLFLDNGAVQGVSMSSALAGWIG